MRERALCNGAGMPPAPARWPPSARSERVSCAVRFGDPPRNRPMRWESEPEKEANPSMSDRRQSHRAEEALRHFVHTPLDALLDAAAGARSGRARRSSQTSRATVPAYARLPASTALRSGERCARSRISRACRSRRRTTTCSASSAAEPVPRRQARRTATWSPSRRARRASRRSGRASSTDELRDRRALRAGLPRQLRTPHERTHARGRLLRARDAGSAACTRRACCRHLAAKGYPITVVTPGQQRDEILRVVAALGAAVRAGRAARLPAVPQGRHRRRARARASTGAAPASSSSWRARSSARSGATSSRDARGHRATRAATRRRSTAPPTPACSATRRRSASASAASWPGDPTRRASCSARRGCRRSCSTTRASATSRTPATATLLFPGDNGVPLVRYHIADEGGLVGFDAMLSSCAARLRPAARARRPRRRCGALPFVYVFGRSHFTVSYYGANVYPENVTVGLEQPAVRDWVTGKFVLQAREDDGDATACSRSSSSSPPGVDGRRAKRGDRASRSSRTLLRLNSEFANYVAGRVPQRRG